MAQSTLLDDLISRWQEHFARGETITPEQLCRDCPELLDDLNRQLKAMDWANRLAADGPDPVSSLRGTGPETVNITPSAPTVSAPTFLRGPEQADEIGRLAGFRILRELGRGGMGWVFLAEDLLASRNVALKVMKPELAMHADARARFLREAQAAARLHHDHITPIFQVGEDNGVLFFTMPFLRGQSLEAHLADVGQAPVSLILQVGRETAEGLAAAHDQGLVHRDIKPANLWLEDRSPAVDEAGRPASRLLVLDFGLARPLESSELTLSGAVLGTPGYMSPEQANGDDVDGRTDLFSLGCVLYRMATGTKPFPGKSLPLVLRATVEHEPRSVRLVRPDLPPVLAELIERLLAKQPGQRPASAKEVATTFRAIERGLPLPSTAVKTSVAAGSPATVVATSVRVSRPQSKRLGIVAALAASALCLAAGVTTYLYLRHPPAEVLSTLPVSPVKPVVAAEQLNVPPEHAARIRAEMRLQVWRKDDLSRALSLEEALPLRGGDYMRVEVTTNVPAYLYIVYLDSEGAIGALYPWQHYDWNDRAPEAPRSRLFLPEDPLKDVAPLSDSATGAESIVVLARDTPLGIAEQETLRNALAAWGKTNRKEQIPGVVWIDADRGFVGLSTSTERGKIDLPKAVQTTDAAQQVRRLLTTELRPLFGDLRAVCYPFKGQ